MKTQANKSTGANACGPRQSQIPTGWTHASIGGPVLPLAAAALIGLLCRALPRLWLLLPVALSCATPVRSQDLLTNGLVIFFPFRGDFYDESGYGAYASPKPATLLWDRFGAPTNAVGFSGADYAVDRVSWHPGGEVTLTYSCWVFAERIVPERQCLFSVASFSLFGGGILPNTRSGVALDPGSSNLFIVFTGAGNDFTSPQPVLRTNEWHHLALTKNSQAVQMFLDGELVARGFTQSGQSVPSRGDLYIGRNGNTPGEQFYGRLDELRVYRRAFSAPEVRQLYTLEAFPRLNILREQAGLRLQALNLFVGTNYQLEISDDLLRWNDWGAPFQSSLSGSSSQLLMVTNANAFWRFRSVP